MQLLGGVYTNQTYFPSSLVFIGNKVLTTFCCFSNWNCYELPDEFQNQGLCLALYILWKFYQYEQHTAPMNIEKGVRSSKVKVSQHLPELSLKFWLLTFDKNILSLTFSTLSDAQAWQFWASNPKTKKVLVTTNSPFDKKKGQNRFPETSKILFESQYLSLLAKRSNRSWLSLNESSDSVRTRY